MNFIDVICVVLMIVGIFVIGFNSAKIIFLNKFGRCVDDYTNLIDKEDLTEDYASGATYIMDSAFKNFFGKSFEED